VPDMLPRRRRRSPNQVLASTLTRGPERRGWVLDSAPVGLLTAISQLVRHSEPLTAVIGSSQRLTLKRKHSAQDTGPDAQFHRREKQKDPHIASDGGLGRRQSDPPSPALQS
jgi:hypothetical protein